MNTEVRLLLFFFFYWWLVPPEVLQPWRPIEVVYYSCITLWMLTVSNPSPETIFCKVTQKMHGATPEIKL
jgi:hypothetical protein